MARCKNKPSDASGSCTSPLNTHTHTPSPASLTTRSATYAPIPLLPLLSTIPIGLFRSSENAREYSSAEGDVASHRTTERRETAGALPVLLRTLRPRDVRRCCCVVCAAAKEDAMEDAMFALFCFVQRLAAFLPVSGCANGCVCAFRG